jgi:hypothetical protein
MKHLLIFSTIILTSCSSLFRQKGFDGTQNAVLDLAYSAYLRGCIDSLPKGKPGDRIEVCRPKALSYQKEIEPIIRD